MGFISGVFKVRFAEKYGLNTQKYGLISYLSIEVFFNYMAGEETFRKIHIHKQTQAAFADN